MSSASRRERPLAMNLQGFLREAREFRLGDLLTEQPHPGTVGLAEKAVQDLPAAIGMLAAADRQALEQLRLVEEPVAELAVRIRETLEDGARVWICGCGATGRLALSLEALWRQKAAPAMADRVVSLMAGGDLALIRSIEGFEDDRRAGGRHLLDLGFGDDDLLVSCTEGGETSWVIGATEVAASTSGRFPWFLCCNPPEQLRTITRSREILDHARIRCLTMPVGPMALSGSTRMQATTALMLATGLALFYPEAEGIRRQLDQMEELLAGFPLTDLVPFIEQESAASKAGRFLFYLADRHAITVLTDTTERSPTFSLTPFENQDCPEDPPSLCYLNIPAAANAEEGWHHLLGRPPRPLSWPEVADLAGPARLAGFDFSRAGGGLRRQRLAGAVHLDFTVDGGPGELRWALGENRSSWSTGGAGLVVEHVLLKVLLNMHSTLTMGRLGRYQSNVMTWVRPSNRKLVDRAIRYAAELLRQEGITGVSYEQLAAECFRQIPRMAEDEPIVPRMVTAIRPSD